MALDHLVLEFRDSELPCVGDGNATNSSVRAANAVNSRAVPGAPDWVCFNKVFQPRVEHTA